MCIADAVILLVAGDACAALASCLLQRYSVRRASEAPGGQLSLRSWKEVRDFVEANLERGIERYEVVLKP